MYIETNRLIIRSFEPQDVHALAQRFYGDVPYDGRGARKEDE